MTHRLEYHAGKASAASALGRRVLLSRGAWLALGIVFAVATAGIITMFTMVIGYGVSPLAGIPVPVAGIVLLVLTSGLFIALRRNRGNAVLAYVEQAVRLNLPLPAMLAAAERVERGRTRIALRNLRLQIESGSPLSVSLAAAMPSLPLRTTHLIASAERVGRLPQALQRLTRPGRAEGTSFIASRGNAFLRWYPLLTLLMLGLVFNMVCIFVMPKYQEIFRDFRLELPASTKLMLISAEWLAFPLLGVLAIALLALLARTVGTIIAPGWSVVNPFRGITERLAWHIWPWRGIVRARAMSDACHVIADALESGRPLTWAVDEAARGQANLVMEGRLAEWAERLRQGESPPDAAKAAGMPDLFVGMLRTAAGADTVELLRFLARYYESRFSRSAVLLRAMLVPAVAIGTGIPVALFIYSLYSPLLAMIDGICQMIERL